MNNRTEYDYIIVGAGSAGCVLASRLSDDSTCRVLLIEAGAEARTPFAEIPGAAAWMQGSALDWAFATTPQTELFDRCIPYPRGRVVGGTSVLNYMVYVRGNRGDYDGWLALGNQGWSYEDVLPYFRRSERNAVFNDAYHGAEGPLRVETNPARHPICATFIEAAQATGLPFNPDFNGATQAGCGYFQATLENGRRCSTARAYLDPIRSRPNLSLVPNGLVLRIIVENERALGVEFINNGRELHTAIARSEVLCAAGAIGSPHLLMLSGIGPANALRKHGIEVAVDLPGVGQDLQDHLSGFSVGVTLKDPERHFPGTPSSIADALSEFEATGTGLLATQHLDAGAFISLEGDTWPSLQSIFTPGIAEFYRSDGAPDTGHVYIGGYVCRPKSRGTVTLASSNPLDRPLIDPKYFSEPDDMRMTKELIRRNIEILLSMPLREISHGDVPLVSDNDAELETFMRRRASTSWHPTSTCRMGRDDRAVVTPELRVRGIDGLRVCDASVMPVMISGNTNAAVIMIAEKAADLIRKTTHLTSE